MPTSERGLKRGQFYALFILGCSILSGTWAEFDQLGFGVSFAFLFALVFLTFAPWLSLNGPLPKISFQQRQITSMQSLLGAASICAVPTLFLILSWNQEFPFSGDHDFHLQAQLASRSFIAHSLLPLTLIFGVLLVGCK